MEGMHHGQEVGGRYRLVAPRGRGARPTLPEGALLTRTPGLWMRRRGSRMLFLAPEAASWIILEEPWLGFWQKLSRPMTWAGMFFAASARTS